MSELLDWAFRGKRSGQTTGHKSRLKGYRLTKDGKLIKDQKQRNVIQRLQARTRTRFKRGK